MDKFTFIAICKSNKSNIYVSQYSASDVIEAELLWLHHLDLPNFTEKDKRDMAEDIECGDFLPTLLNTLDFVWFDNPGPYPYKKTVRLHIVKTAYNHSNCRFKINKYTFIAFYKGGMYVSQFSASDVVEAERLWAKNLSTAYTEYFEGKVICKIQEKIAMGENTPIAIETVDSTWYTRFKVSNKPFLLYIVETVDS